MILNGWIYLEKMRIRLLRLTSLRTSKKQANAKDLKKSKLKIDFLL